jgi:hypothetical protein
MPRWWIHLKQNEILEEDLSQLLGQQEQVERLGRNIKQVYSPLPTCDTFAIEYRKWLDRFGASLPFYRGYTTSKASQNADECKQNSVPMERSLRHTELCSSCNRAYQVTKRLKPIFVGVAIALAALAIVTDGSWIQLAAVSASLGAVALATVLGNFQTKFECS